MPLDGKIEQFTRAVPEGQEADPFSLGSLIAWLETMPPRGRYQFLCRDGSCLIGQYMQAKGASWSYPEGYRPFHFAPHGKSWDPAYDGLTFGALACAHPHTFGAALARARSLESAARQA